MIHIIRPIAHMESDFPEKFGIPRQAGVVRELESVVVFEPEYRDPEALRGIEGFSRLWLIWQFSKSLTETFSPTVRPPRLGGNVRMGVFATRSPFRPNSLGLSCVELKSVENRPGLGTVLVVKGADLMDGTPIYDIKPYLEYVDSHTGVRSGFVDERQWQELKVEMSEELQRQFTNDELQALMATLRQDPRPQYHDDPQRTYGMPFAGRDVRFRVEDGTLFVTHVEPVAP